MGKRELTTAPEAPAKHTPGAKGRRTMKKKKHHPLRWIIALLVLIILFAGAYLTAVYSNIPVIKKWRDIYIETAMSTKSHRWLATSLLPDSVVDEVMAQVSADVASQADLSSSWETSEETEEPEVEAIDPSVQGSVSISHIYYTDASIAAVDAFYETYWELDCDNFRNYIDSNPGLVANGYDNLVIEDLSGDLGLQTVNGDTVIVVNVPENLLIVQVTGSSFVSKLAICKNAAQVDLVKSSTLGTEGQRIAEIQKENGSLVTINCSGFGDTNGVGNGGYVMGSLILDGVEYGDPYNVESTWKFFGMKYDNRLYITNYDPSIIGDYRWGAMFYPALIVNGESVVDGTFGMGIQPRATIGQCLNGDFMMLIVDGRQPGYSLGCTVADCVEVMLSYHAYQATNLDGGSSAIMLYKDTQITKPSSVQSIGRLLPDALVVMPVASVK